MKRILIILFSICYLYIPSAEAVKLHYCNEQLPYVYAYDEDSLEYNREYSYGEFYILEMENSAKNYFQNLLGYNNNIKNNTDYIKYKIVYLHSSGIFRKYDYECYDKDNKLIYRSKHKKESNGAGFFESNVLK